MAPPNTTDTTYLDTQLDAMTAQLSVLSFAPTTVTSALTDRFRTLLKLCALIAKNYQA